MPHLQTLDGQPLEWAVLLAMNEAWHAARERPVIEVPTGRSARCCGPLTRRSEHGACQGHFSANVDGLYALGRCVCECHALVLA